MENLKEFTIEEMNTIINALLQLQENYKSALSLVRDDKTIKSIQEEIGNIGKLVTKVSNVEYIMENPDLWEMRKNLHE